MVWRPLQPNHAIERARIIVRYNSVLPEKFLRKLSVDGESERLSLGFNNTNSREGHQIAFGPGVQNTIPSEQQYFGWDWQKLSTNNSPLEILVQEDRSLIYESLEYSRWGEFSERFGKVSNPFLEAASEVVDVASVSLEYVDRFVFEGAPEKADPTLALKNLENVVEGEALTGRKLWHFHRGWFERLDDENVLVNQNIDAQDGTVPEGNSVRSLQIFTKTELRLVPGSFSLVWLQNSLQSLHKRSKEVFAQNLTDDLIEKIGIHK